MMRVKSMDQINQPLPNSYGSDSQDLKDTVTLVNADHAK